MRGTWRVLLMLFAALLASVNAAPPFTSHQTYVGCGLHRVLVFANVADMSLRQHMEFRIVQGFTDRRIQAVSSMAVLPPAYQFSDLRTDSLVGAQGADALLLVTVGAPGAESIPFQPATSKSDGGIAGPDTSAPHPVPSQRWIAARGGLWPWTSFKAVLLATRTSRGVWGGIASGHCCRVGAAGLHRCAIHHQHRGWRPSGRQGARAHRERLPSLCRSWRKGRVYRGIQGSLDLRQSRNRSDV